MPEPRPARNPRPPRRKRRRILLLLILAMAAAAVFLYLADSYPATEQAKACLASPAQSVEVLRGRGRIDFLPEEARAGLIFYPGGKVQFEAYAPLMEAFARRGVLCVLLRMPGNLAVLAPDAAAGIAADYPEIRDWYVGGHSLGGAMAASYAAGHSQELTGVLLLGAYSVGDLTETGLRVLSVYGSEDGVMDRKRYEDGKRLLPADFSELVLEGGCHAYFGCYGPQRGDGTPTITPEEQIARTAEAFSAFLGAEDASRAA